MGLLQESFIYWDTAFSSKQDLFNFAAEKLTQSGFAENEHAVVEGLWSREQEFSTYVDYGSAIPHCRISEIKETAILIFRNQGKIPWDEDSQADLIFLLAVPADHVAEFHLRVLAKLAQAIISKDFIDKVRNATNAQEVIQYLEFINEVETKRKEA